jgi:hypothetical protein
LKEVLENEVFATGGETCGETKEALGANHADLIDSMIGGTLAELFQLNLFSCPPQGSSLGIKQVYFFIFSISWKQPQVFNFAAPISVLRMQLRFVLTLKMQTNPREVYSAFRNRAVRCNYMYLPGVQLGVDGMVTGSGFNHSTSDCLSAFISVGKPFRNIEQLDELI